MWGVERDEKHIYKIDEKKSSRKSGLTTMEIKISGFIGDNRTALKVRVREFGTTVFASLNYKDSCGKGAHPPSDGGNPRIGEKSPLVGTHFLSGRTKTSLRLCPTQETLADGGASAEANQIQTQHRTHEQTRCEHTTRQPRRADHPTS